MEGQELQFFLFGGSRKKLHIDLQCIVRCDYLSPHSAIVSGIENYPSASVSHCSDDLAQLLPCLDL